MKSFKGLTKLLTVGALALAVSIPAGVSTASAATTTVQYKTYYAVQGSTDMNAMIQQYLKQSQAQYPQYRFVYQPSTPSPAAKPVTRPVAAKPAAKPVTHPVNAGTTTTVSSFASQVFNLVNQERAKAGLKALKMDAPLTNVALVKAKDMKNNNYFDHNSPTYGSPFDMMKKFGITYRYAGENIAMGQRSPQEVMKAWMNSPGHRANILNANYSLIGVAYYNGEWVQEFKG